MRIVRGNAGGRVGLALFLAMIASSGLARAEELSRAVLLGVDVEGYMPSKELWQKEYASLIETKLQESGHSTFQLVPSVACEDAACFEKQLAPSRATTGVYLTITRELTRPPAYMIRLFVYQRGASAPFQPTESRCVLCSEHLVGERIGTLLGDVQAAKPSQTSQAKVPRSAHTAASAIWYTVGGIGTALLIAGAVGLAVSVPEHNMPACGADLPSSRECTLRHNNTTAIALSGAGLAVGAILVPLGFVMAARTKTLHSLSFFPTGLGLTIKGEF